MKYLVCAAVLAAGLTQPAFAQDDESDTSNGKAGIRIEARATYETPTVSSVNQQGDVYKLGSAFAWGGEAGFDIAVSNGVVIGPYGTYEFSSVENCDGTDCISVTDNYEFGLHAGFNVGQSGLVYVKAGYGSMGLKAEIANITDEERGGGVAGAIGYEHGFGKNFYGRVELGYSDNGEIFGLNFQRRHAGVALGARF
jgi:outer membrane immunogenic protein